MPTEINAEDIHYIKSTLKTLVERQKIIDDKMEDISKNVTKLHSRMLGDEEFQQKGLVHDVASLKKYIENDKTLKNRLYGGVVIMGIVWTVIYDYIKSKF